MIPPEDKKRELLTLLQTEFPVKKKPFQVLGQRTGISEKEILKFIAAMMDQKVIRALGPVFEPSRLGYTGTLVTAMIPNMYRVADFSAAAMDINEITHNYMRDHAFNVWFTITAASDERISELLEWTRTFPGVKEMLNLPIVRRFKIEAVFGTDTPKKDTAKIDTAKETLTKKETDLIKALQEDFPLVEQPYAVIAQRAEWDEQAALERIVKWIVSGTIRRFGARLSPQRFGYTCNSLMVWSGGDVDDWGEIFAQMPAVSHCYKRKVHPNWPYELYTMVHAGSIKELDTIILKMKLIALGSKMLSLRTKYELKKSTMKYFME